MAFAYFFTALLFWGILTLWVPAVWAWAFVQSGVFVLVAARVLRKPTFRLRGAYVPLMLAAAWPVVQLLSGRTVSPGNTLVAALDWWTFLLIFLLACGISAAAAVRGWFLRAAVLGGTLLALISLAQEYSAGGTIFWLFPSGYAKDVFGPFVNRNQFAAWIELLLPAALFLAAIDQRARIIYGVCAAVLFSAVIASGSRMGALLAVGEVLAATALFVVRKAQPKREAWKQVLQFAALAAITVAVAGSQNLLNRLAPLGPEESRADAWQASIRMVADKPWMGTGLGTWSTIYPKYAQIDTGMFVNQAHNDWAQWAAEGGVPFFAFMLLFAIVLVRPAVRSIFGIGVIAVLLHALVDYPMQQRPALAAWLFAMAGAAMAESTDGQIYESEARGNRL